MSGSVHPFLVFVLTLSVSVHAFGQGASHPGPAEPDKSAEVLRKESIAEEKFEEAPWGPHWGDVPWLPQYRRFHWIEGVVTGVAGATSVAMRIIGPPGDGPTGGVWIDEGVRDALRARTLRGRVRAEDASDVLLSLSTTYGLLFDPLINAVWFRRSPDTGVQLALINTEVIAVTLGAQQGIANSIGRERPYGRTCGTTELADETESCLGSDRYRSFFSGHTSVPFAIASATCTHHLFLHLSHDQPILACTAGFLVAASSGTLRIVSDNHYATDVLTGAATGMLVGFSIPLFHYLTGHDAGAAQLPDGFWMAPTWGGLQMGGVW